MSSCRATNANGPELRDEPRRASRARREGQAFPTHDGWSSAQPDMVRVVHGVPTRLHGAGNATLRKQLALPSRRIKALGNAVVPQCAEVIGHVIAELMR